MCGIFGLSQKAAKTMACSPKTVNDLSLVSAPSWRGAGSRDNYADLGLASEIDHPGFIRVKLQPELLQSFPKYPPDALFATGADRTTPACADFLSDGPVCFDSVEMRGIERRWTGKRVMPQRIRTRTDGRTDGSPGTLTGVVRLTLVPSPS